MWLEGDRDDIAFPGRSGLEGPRDSTIHEGTVAPVDPIEHPDDHDAHG